MISFRDGSFAFDATEANPTGELQIGDDEVWDMAACAAFKDAFDKRLAEAAAAEEEGNLTAERARELQRALEHNIHDMDPADIEGLEADPAEPLRA